MCAGPMSTRISIVRKPIDDKTKAIFIEILANPGGTFVDIAAIAKIARKAGVPLIVDNTLATPYLIRPFEHGANIVVHSLTKFMGGHGNSMGGVIVDGGNFDWSKSGRYPLLSEPRPDITASSCTRPSAISPLPLPARVLGLRDLGPSIAPLNAFLILTGMETLGLRMQRHCDNALKVAEWLQESEGFVGNYAGLKGHKHYASEEVLPARRRLRLHLRSQGRLR